MTDLRNLLALQNLAEERARQYHEALSARKEPLGYMRRDWTTIHETWGTLLINVELDILCNLENPDSRDAVARLVAERLGLVCGATAPTLWRWTPAGGGWALGSGGPDAAAGAAIFHSGDILAVENSRGQTWRTIAGISAITDPALALTQIALAVLSETA